MTDECDPEYHRIDTFRILRRGRGLPDAELANRMAIFTASECAEVAKEYQARIEALEATILHMGDIAAKDTEYYQARIEELEAHIRVLLDTDPNAQYIHEWRSVLDVWRDEAKYILQIKGTDDE